MKDKKITTNGLSRLDECLKGGLKKGETYIMASGIPSYKSNFIRFLPTANPLEYQLEMGLDQSEEITKKGIELIREMMGKLSIKEMENHTVTKYEKIGDTIFPVNYHSDGIITVDYPDSLFCNRVKGEKNKNTLLTVKKPTGYPSEIVFGMGSYGIEPLKGVNYKRKFN
jgi:hypothetical protein